MVSASSPSQVRPNAKLPWSLACICWLCVLSCPVPAVVLWAFNNRRLGIVQPVLTRIFIAASFAIYGLVLVRFFLVDEESLQAHRLRFVGLAVTLVLAWQLYSSQRAAFARYCKAGGKTAALKWPILSGFTWLLVLGCLQLGADTVHADRDYKEFERVAASLEKSRAKRDDAELFFQKFKRKYPEEPMTYWNLAIIYAEADRIGNAKKELQDLLELEPDNKDARDYLEGLEWTP